MYLCYLLAYRRCVYLSMLTYIQHLSLLNAVSWTPCSCQMTKPPFGCVSWGAIHEKCNI